MTYIIEVTYKTGYSGKSWIENKELEIQFQDPQIAINNLNRIIQHGLISNEIKGSYYNEKDEEKIFNYLKANYEWFDSDKNQKYYHVLQSLNLILENGNKLQISAFWRGYFERFISASIKKPQENEEEEIKGFLHFMENL